MKGKRKTILKIEITLLVFLATLTSLTLAFSGAGDRAASPPAPTGVPEWDAAVTAEASEAPDTAAGTAAEAPAEDSDTPPPPVAEDMRDERYITLHLSENDLAFGDLILVNGGHYYEIPENGKLVRVADNKTRAYVLLDGNALLSEKILGPLNAMMDDFAAETGMKNVLLYSSFRTMSKQQSVFNDWAGRVGSEEAARMAAAPGYSEHHTGLAFDLAVYSGDVVSTFKGTGKYTWIHENAHKYGFVLRYPDEKQAITKTANEPWHFRYIGAAHAYFMLERGYCFEEYMEYLTSFEFSGTHLLDICDGVLYEIYYVEGTNVPIPADREYTLSGDNYGGFIVTVNNGPAAQDSVVPPPKNWEVTDA